jgi:hypothetical protein
MAPLGLKYCEVGVNVMQFPLEGVKYPEAAMIEEPFTISISTAP